MPLSTTVNTPQTKIGEGTICFKVYLPKLFDNQQPTQTLLVVNSAPGDELMKDILDRGAGSYTKVYVPRSLAQSDERVAHLVKNWGYMDIPVFHDLNEALFSGNTWGSVSIEGSTSLYIKFYVYVEYSPEFFGHMTSGLGDAADKKPTPFYVVPNAELRDVASLRNFIDHSPHQVKLVVGGAEFLKLLTEEIDQSLAEQEKNKGS